MNFQLQVLESLPSDEEFLKADSDNINNRYVSIINCWDNNKILISLDRIDRLRSLQLRSTL